MNRPIRVTSGILPMVGGQDAKVQVLKSTAKLLHEVARHYDRLSLQADSAGGSVDLPAGLRFRMVVEGADVQIIVEETMGVYRV